MLGGLQFLTKGGYQELNFKRGMVTPILLFIITELIQIKSIKTDEISRPKR